MAEPQGSEEDGSIVGLRTQIFANAAALYPVIVAGHHTYASSGIVKADQIFDIITAAHKVPRSEDIDGVARVEHRAVITYGAPMSREFALKSDFRETMTKALQALLEKTAFLLSKSEDLMDVLGGTETEIDILGEGEEPAPLTAAPQKTKSGEATNAVKRAYTRIDDLELKETEEQRIFCLIAEVKAKEREEEESERVFAKERQKEKMADAEKVAEAAAKAGEELKRQEREAEEREDAAILAGALRGGEWIKKA